MAVSSRPAAHRRLGKPRNYQVSDGDKHGKRAGHIVIPVKLAILYVQTAGFAMGFIAHNGIVAIDIGLNPSVGIIIGHDQG